MHDLASSGKAPQILVGGYSAVWTVVMGFLVPKDNVEESLYISFCINTVLYIEYIYVCLHKWYILNCSCPSFQNYFAASECQFADSSKYYNGVRKNTTMQRALVFLRGWGSWVSSHLGWYKPMTSTAMRTMTLRNDECVLCSRLLSPYATVKGLSILLWNLMCVVGYQCWLCLQNLQFFQKKVPSGLCVKMW